jgi:hypothetical protein
MLICGVAHAEPVAVIAAAKGEVQVQAARGGKPINAPFGRPLERGDRVSVGASSSATVFFNDGNVVELAEKSALTVGARAAAAKDATALPGEVFTQVSRFVTSGSRESGLVSLSGMRSAPASAALIAAPRQCDVLDDRPALAWRAVDGATRYRVSVSGEKGELWTREVSRAGTAWPGDAPALARDADYLWEVEALADRSLRRESSTFHVVSASQAESVRGDLARIRAGTGTAEAAGAFLAGSYLCGRGLYCDATAPFEALARLSPASPAPHEALGQVYRAIGLMDLAVAEYQKALALTREP